MPHTVLGLPAVLCPSAGYLAVASVLALAAAWEPSAARESSGVRGPSAGPGPAGHGRRWAAALWAMPGYFPALVLSPWPDGTSARFLGAVGAGAVGNAALLACVAHAAGLR
ncbi:hypothetical protein OH807_37745 [Kitasatospora sp. NBC_01560]|uniref:hypothetical protein n=1 Tax=Kitasatospora sp. NBC_01560 TaxID=2975965 RepID=UPI0038702ADC